MAKTDIPFFGKIKSLEAYYLDFHTQTHELPKLSNVV